MELRAEVTFRFCFQIRNFGGLTQQAFSKQTRHIPARLFCTTCSACNHWSERSQFTERNPGFIWWIFTSSVQI